MEEDADVIALRNLPPRKMSRGRVGLRECPPADGRQMDDGESDAELPFREAPPRREKIAPRNIFAVDGEKVVILARARTVRSPVVSLRQKPRRVNTSNL